MKTSHRYLTLAAILLAPLVSVSCSRAVTWGSTTPASWSYVEKSWGGIALGNPTIEADRVDLPFRLGVHEVERVDSGICIRRLTGRFDKGRAIVRFDKYICEGSHRTTPIEQSAKDFVARLDKPAPGKYDVVYDDVSAGFPKLGEVEVR